MAHPAPSPSPSRRPDRVQRRSGRRSWGWLLGHGLLMLLAGLWVASLASDVRTVQAELTATRKALTEAQRSLADLDVKAAQQALAPAEQHVEVARDRIERVSWTLVGVIPILGDPVDATRAVVDVVEVAVEVGQVATTRGAPFLDDGEVVPLTDGKLDLDAVLAVRGMLADMPLDELAEARDRLVAAEPRWAPSGIRDGRAIVLSAAGELLELTGRGEALFDALPTFFGSEGPRRYFLAVQTPAELRGTGGVIGYWAVLEVDEGELHLTDGGVHDAMDEVPTASAGPEEPVTGRIGRLAGDPEDAVTTTAEFEERYHHTAAAGSFSNVNVDPHLPTTARVTLDLFTHRTGEELDGMILINPVGMQGILEAIGEPLTIPPSLAEPPVPATLPPSRFARFALVDVYEIYGAGHSEARKALLRTLGDLAFAKVLAGHWDGAEVSRVVAAASRRHLQLYSEDRREQSAFSRLGVAGELVEPTDRDLLAVTVNNAVGGKQDVYVGHRVAADVTLDLPRSAEDGDSTLVRRDLDLTVEVDNPLPSTGMDLYVIGNCLVEGDRNRCFEGPPGWNRSWFSIWTRGEHTLQDRRTPQGTLPVTVGDFRGLSVVDHHLETPPRDRAWFELTLVGDVPVVFDGEALIYRLDWWRQAKAIPDLIEVTITPPDRWAVVEVVVDGGGEGRGMGVHGGGVPLRADVRGDGRGVVVGTVDADTSIEVRLEPEQR